MKRCLQGSGESPHGPDGVRGRMRPVTIRHRRHRDQGYAFVSAEAAHPGRAPSAAGVSGFCPGAEALVTPMSPERKNIQAIMGLERETRGKRSVLERITDGVSGLASSPAFIFAHILWFAVWIGANSLGRARFDAYPLQLADTRRIS
jgi:hypothetical protein